MREEFSDKTKSLTGLLITVLALACLRGYYPDVKVPFSVMVLLVLCGMSAQDVLNAFRNSNED